MIILKFPSKDRENFQQGIREAFSGKTWFGYAEKEAPECNTLWPVKIETRETMHSPITGMKPDEVSKLLERTFNISCQEEQGVTSLSLTLRENSINTAQSDSSTPAEKQEPKITYKGRRRDTASKLEVA